jgi:hypothetical protein
MDSLEMATGVHRRGTLLRPRALPVPIPGVTLGPRLLPRFQAERLRTHVVGAHGGSGESTVAAWMGAVATGHRWPSRPDDLPADWPTDDDRRPLDVPVVITARTSASGLASAQGALREWASGSLDVELLGLVLIADAPGRLPRQLHDYAAVVGGAAPAVVHIGWIKELRLEPSTPHHSSARVRSLQREDRAAATLGEGSSA